MWKVSRPTTIQLKGSLVLGAAYVSIDLFLIAVLVKSNPSKPAASDPLDQNMIPP